MPPGRPRNFDTEKALDQALKVFWRKGYEGASLPDLTQAMGINRPSLYAAFGNKQSLFCKALKRYHERQRDFFRQALEAPTAYEVARRILHGAVTLQTDAGNPRGCLSVRGSLSCGESALIRKHLTAGRAAIETTLSDRLQRAIDERDLPKNPSAQDLSRYLSTVIQGLSIQSANGATRAELLGIANTALLAFPATRKRHDRR